MKQLEICRRQKEKFTVVMVFTDYDAFPYDGTFPDVYYYYRLDSEAELIEELNKEDELLDEAIETIYFGTDNVTEKYLERAVINGHHYYKLRGCFRKNSI